MRHHVGGAIHMLHNLMRRDCNQVPYRQELDRLTGNHSYILCYLYDHRHEDIFQRDLEKQFQLRRSSATNALQIMERNGLIQRLPVASDARLKKLVLTPYAVELDQRIREAIEQTEARLVQGLTQQETETLWNLLNKIRLNLEKGLFSEEQNIPKEEKHDQKTDGCCTGV